MDIAVVGGGVAGLSLALHLHKRGLTCRVYESAPEVKELGVGITLLPHAMKEFTEIGLEGDLAKAGLETQESCFFNRFGQLIYAEPRGRYAGYKFPEYSIHRGRLHLVLYNAALARLGRERILTNHHCVGVAQDDRGATLSFVETLTRTPRPPVRADVVVACDGVNSTVRKAFYPDEKLAFAGINTWRGITKWKPIRTGRTYMRIGSINTGKLVVYPIIDDVDGKGNQLINWMAEIQTAGIEQNDWNRPGRLEDFFPIYASWTFDWCDIAGMIRNADMVLEYPMVDKDPVERWTFGRVTFAGDAAHPMYPRGSTGAAQGAVDARTLADCLAATPDPAAAFRAYEDKRLNAANNVVTTNRKFPPDYINIRVEELVGDRPFDDLDKYISQDELRALSDRYKAVAGYSLQDLGR
jgi:2-polyprenyl-6-methoxyphenol hydroxylase-like FAD-dependent oxidoreductase